MRYDDYDEYNSRYSRGSSRSGSSSSYDRSRSGYSGRYDRDGGHGSGRSSGGYSGSGYDWNYEDRYYDRGYSSDYSRRSGQSYDRSGGRSRSGYDSFDPENWRRTAPNWEDHSEPEPPRRRSSSSGNSRSGSSRRPDYDRDRRSASSRSRSSSSSRNGSRRWDYDRDRRRSGSSPRGRNRRRRVNPVPIILLIVVIVLAAVLLHAFLGGGGKDKYSISFSTQSIVVGETAQATLNGVPSGTSPTIIWSSSDNNVVSVSGDGIVCTLTAKSTGQATIGATIEGKTVASGGVMVVETAPGVVEIKLGQEEVSVVSGSQYTIQATVVMEKSDMAPAKITWTSADPSVARVLDGGIIEAREVGQTIVKGTAGEKTAELVVRVTENTGGTTHDAAATTGQEPEEGVVIPPEVDATLDPNTGTETTDTGGEGEGEGEGEEEVVAE